MCKSTLITFVTVCGLWPTQKIATPLLVGSDVPWGNLLRIDPTTGAGTAIGLLGDPVVAGLGLDWNSDILYGSSSNTNNLLTIDPSTGATTVVGPFGVSLMHALEYNSNSNVLGLAFIPEPTSAGVVIAGVLLVARRRR